MATDSFGCVGNSIRLRSGAYFDFLNPRWQEIQLADIAGALSKICRFGGQIDVFYSVAEHSIMCANQAFDDGNHPDCIRAVFLHDAAEAFVGDVVRPLKLMLPEFAMLERRVEQAIERRFGVDFSKYKLSIREIDNAMLLAERRAMFSPDDVEWFGEKSTRKLDRSFRLFGPAEAERAFLECAKQFFVS